ncbi:MAG: PepSY domain-containing protein, partial [Oscillospiraceae bacterium]|nr:PepSY domain-containing protein [Oscillospiraceae bacterium]
HIALLDAGTSEGLVYDMSVRLKTDGERTVYEIGFRDYQALYFYVVDAGNGEILNKSRTDS